MPKPLSLPVTATRWSRLVPMLLLCTATAATADVTWTGGSLLGPHWHHALNWADGQLPDSNDRALLGNADTFISQGQFVRAFQGSGTLTVQNSFLGMYGPPGVGSLIGTLRLEDSMIAGFESNVRAGGLWLQNAVVGDPLDSGTSELRADNGATLTGSLAVSGAWALRLSGQTSWAAGNGDLRFASGNHLAQAALWVDATGVFTDHGAGAGTRIIGSFQAPGGTEMPRLQVDGVYRKAGGSGDTSIQINLAVAGELAVEQGSVTLWGLSKSITGRLSTAAGGTLRSPATTLEFVGAQVVNNGGVQIGDVGFAADATIDAGTQWVGSGSLSVVGAQNLNIFSVVTNDGSVQTGRLDLREHSRLLGSGSFETVALAILPATGSYVAIGTLSGTVGPSITATGTAVLGGQTVVWGGSRLALDGNSSWDSRGGGDALIFVDNPSGGTVNGRNSRLSIGTSGVFRDEACTAPCERSIQGPNVPGAEFVVAGTYIKRGEHRTSLGSGLQFSNSGRIVAQEGQLRLYGVDNTGTLHADGGRIRVSGLAQWQPGTQTLQGGTYRVNSFGVMALELGSDAQPRLIRVNNATVLLDGPQATLLNRVNDNLAVDAMAGLAEQRGTLHLTGGAQLLLGTAGLQQSGSLLIGQGSRLRTEGNFRQTAGATWLDGLLQSPNVTLIGGRFGAGDASRIGQGNIEAAVWRLGADAVLDVDLVDSAWDRIDSTGTLTLAGGLDAEFDLHLAPGAKATYRVLSAAGGVSGSLASLTHNLDVNLYQVWAEVGATYVDLHVSAVPEAGTWATTAAGLLALLMWSRRRGAGRALAAITFSAAAATAPAYAEPVVLWDQSNFGIGIGPVASTTVPLNDFELLAPTAVSGFRVWMRDNSANSVVNPGDGLANGVFTDFSGVLSWYLFADNNGTPGALLESGDALAPQVVDSGQDAVGPFLDDIFEVTVNFAAPVNLAAGRTWLGIREGLRGSAMDGSEVLWMGTPVQQGEQRWFFRDGQHLADLQGPAALDAAFQILGTQQVPEPGSAPLVALALLVALMAPLRPTRAATVHLADIVAAPTGVMDFEDAPDNFNGAIGRSGDGIRIQQIAGDGGSDIWSASGLGHGRAWYPDAGDDGWTRIRRAGGENFDAVSFFGGSSWIAAPQSLYFELADDGVVVLSGTLAASFTGSWFGFAGGDFDELRIRASQGGVTGLLDCPSGGTGDSCNFAWVDDIRIGAAAVPLPSTALLSLAALGLLAATGRGRRHGT